MENFKGYIKGIPFNSLLEFQCFQRTALCHYNYEYSNIFPPIFYSLCKPLLKNRCLVLSIWYILIRVLLTFSTKILREAQGIWEHNCY